MREAPVVIRNLFLTFTPHIIYGNPLWVYGVVATATVIYTAYKQTRRPRARGWLGCGCIVTYR